MKKVLIANRGEIAVRIIRACADNGLDSVAVFSDPDVDALHTRFATEAYALEGSALADTYLNANKIIDIALRSRADAIHPGYGFLSESAGFAEAVITAGLTWVGPPPEVIKILGDKLNARRAAMSVGAPLAPGSDGPVLSPDEVDEFGAVHGYPIIIKAAFGGGGRGMKVVRGASEVVEAFDSATREAELAFGRRECFIEKLLQKPRHVEAQVLADTHGNVAVIGLRDCSVQRRNQKLIEEAPAPALAPELEQQIRESAAALCREVGYIGAGTVEFLLDVEGKVSFLEVNTRLQVEHPVTEESTGIDIVSAQLRIAEGHSLELAAADRPSRHSLEFRINAEDPGRGFVPSPGLISRLEWPTGPGIRVDSGVTVGSLVPAQYDSLIAKIIVSGATRAEAINRARRALRETVIEGVATVIPFHLQVLDAPEFLTDADYGCHTGWVDSEFENTAPPSSEFSNTVAIEGRTRFSIEVDGKRVSLGLPSRFVEAMSGSISQLSEDSTNVEKRNESEWCVLAPSAGVLVKWLVEEGELVSEGTPIAVLEAMKMECQVFAHRAGTIQNVVFSPGDQVSVGEVMVEIAYSL